MYRIGRRRNAALFVSQVLCRDLAGRRSLNGPTGDGRLIGQSPVDRPEPVGVRGRMDRPHRGHNQKDALELAFVRFDIGALRS